MKNSLFVVNGLFAVGICTLACAVALNYRDLETIGFANCPLKNRCSQIGNASFTERLCECDYSCRTFGDCCIDVARRNSRRPRQMCMQYGDNTFQGIYMFNSCSNGYMGPDEVILQCMHNNFSDPLVSAPVTDISSGKTYLNRYCAICNDVSPTSMMTWKIYFSCDSETNDISYDDIKYNPDVRKWGYDKNGSFNPCKFIYDKPLSTSVIGRPCRPNIVTSCSSNWTRSTYRSECQTYMAVVTDLYNIAYKNPHCALCNNVAAGDLMCLFGDVLVRARVPFSMALLLDVNSSDGNQVGISRSAGGSCPRGQKFDPYFKKCRTLVCGLPGYSAVNGKCVKQ